MLKKNKKEKYPRVPLANSESCKSSFDLENNINWTMFRIMAELVEGFQFLSTLEKEVSFFGSNILKKNTKYYKLAEKLAYKLGEKKYTIITRGGNGIMEAANKGAVEAGSESVSLNLKYDSCKHENEYANKNLVFEHYFTQKLMMSASAQAYIFFPGGFGTLDNFFELILLIQTKKMSSMPVILIGKDFWEPILKYIDDILANKYKTIKQEDQNIYTFVGDDIDKAYKLILKTKTRQYF